MAHLGASSLFYEKFSILFSDQTFGDSLERSVEYSLEYKIACFAIFI